MRERLNPVNTVDSNFFVPRLVERVVDLEGQGSVHVSAVCPSEDGYPDVRVVITSLLHDEGRRMLLTWSTDTVRAVARAMTDVADEAEAAVRHGHVDHVREDAGVDDLP